MITRKSAAALAAASLLTVAMAAGCSTKSGSDGAGNNASPSSSRVPSASGTSGPGVTAGAIRIGVVYPDLKAIANVVHIDQGDYQAAFTSVIDDVNSRGGVNGRKLVPVFGPINPIGTAPADAVCTKLTEDDKVFAVVSVYVPNPQCYLATHDTPLIGSATVTAQQAKGARAPWFSSSLTPEHAAPKVLRALNGAAVFKGHKVAVTGLTADETTVQHTVVPTLKQLGVNVVATAINSAPTTDVNAGYQQYRLIAQKFQSVGADVVVAVGNAGTAWPKALQVNHSNYLPRLVATDWNSLAAYVADTSGNDPAVLRSAISGSLVPPNKVGWSDKALKDCVALIRKANPTLNINNPITATSKTPNTWVAPGNACQNVKLLTDMLAAAGKTLNNETLNRGGESLSNVVLPGFGGVALHYGPGHHDGDGPIYVSRYDEAQKQLVTDDQPAGS